MRPEIPVGNNGTETIPFDEHTVLQVTVLCSCNLGKVISVSVHTTFTCSTVLVKSVDHMPSFIVEQNCHGCGAPAIYHRVQRIADHGSGNKAHIARFYLWTSAHATWFVLNLPVWG